MTYWYPLASPTLGCDEIAAAVEVLHSRRTTMGDKVEEFEEAFARHVGAPHAVMVNSGSSADLLIAFALAQDIPRGEVLIPAVTWPTHAWSWLMAGFNVRLIDVEGINTTAEIVEDSVGPETVAVSLVHLMGVPCDTEPILKVAHSEDLTVTEDCCEALGASVGSFGRCAAWSFFFSHHMTTMEGGMVTTAESHIASRLRTLRSHGWARHLDRLPGNWDRRYTFVDWGFNVRPTEIAAAIGLVQLQRLDSMNHARRVNRSMFAQALDDNPFVTLPDVPEGAVASWFGLPMLVDQAVDRDALAAHLEGAGVETRPILAGNLSRQPAACRHGIARRHLPGADRVHDHGLYIGLHPSYDYDVERVARLVNGFCR